MVPLTPNETALPYKTYCSSRVMSQWAMKIKENRGQSQLFQPTICSYGFKDLVNVGRRRRHRLQESANTCYSSTKRTRPVLNLPMPLMGGHNYRLSITIYPLLLSLSPPHTHTLPPPPLHTHMVSAQDLTKWNICKSYFIPLFCRLPHQQKNKCRKRRFWNHSSKLIHQKWWEVYNDINNYEYYV